MIQRKCRLCSALSSKLSEWYCRFLGRHNHCRGVNLRTQDCAERVSAIDLAAPNCSCENFRMSVHSPSPVGDAETITRFAFSPVHFKRNGEFKPSLFSHVNTAGCSVQREHIATDAELGEFVRKFLLLNTGLSWKGVVSAKCADVRSITIGGPTGKKTAREVCVYDTAEEGNPAHAEICRTRRIQEADELELRRQLMAYFGDGKMLERQAYRGGAIWGALPGDLQARP